jgi:hypothetical protein
MTFNRMTMSVYIAAWIRVKVTVRKRVLAHALHKVYTIHTKPLFALKKFRFPCGPLSGMSFKSENQGEFYIQFITLYCRLTNRDRKSRATDC